MYQAYVVQSAGGHLYNIILGKEFKSIDQAYRAIVNYETVCGKCERAVIDPAGKEIPKTIEPKKTIKEKLIDIVDFIGGR